jgi:hypothetical protein
VLPVLQGLGPVGTGLALYSGLPGGGGGRPVAADGAFGATDAPADLGGVQVRVAPAPVSHGGGRVRRHLGGVFAVPLSDAVSRIVAVAGPAWYVCGRRHRGGWGAPWAATGAAGGADVTPAAADSWAAGHPGAGKASAPVPSAARTDLTVWQPARTRSLRTATAHRRAGSRRVRSG